MMDGVQASISRKRKAESQENERLNKRMSLLNLERNGQKLYVPVEQPSASSSKSSSVPKAKRTSTMMQDDSMQLDDTKHKVYIYDLDAELSSDSEASDDGRLVFLPDISRHLRETRIPPMVLANSEGELAGMSKELVLYNVPTSLTIPEEQDSVRRAIIEARARARAKREKPAPEMEEKDLSTNYIGRGDSLLNGVGNHALKVGRDVPMVPSLIEDLEEDDPDAMDLG